MNRQDDYFLPPSSRITTKQEQSKYHDSSSKYYDDDDDDEPKKRIGGGIVTPKPSIINNNKPKNSSRPGNKLLSVLRKPADKRNKVIGRPDPPPSRLQRLQHDKEQADLKIWRMNGKLLRLEAELEECRLELLRKKELCSKQARSLEYLLCVVIPSIENKEQQQINPRGLLGPIDDTIIETSLRVGDYDIGRFLGHGFYSKVFLGTHRATNQKFAIKTLCKKRLEKLGQLEQLELELQVLKTVSHPNIVQLHNVIHAPRQVYLVMSLGYKDLYTYDQHHSLSMHAIQQIMVGILKPLEYLHSSLGICHLDLKPENILIKQDTRNLTSHDIQLCDFGLCAVNTTSTSPNYVPVIGVSGTPGFFCPEMVLNKSAGIPTDGCAADMWSVGVILLEMSEGLPENWMEAYEYYKDSTTIQFELRVQQNLRVVHKRKYYSNSHVHDLVQQLTMWCPQERLTASEALEHEWLYDVAQQQQQQQSCCSSSSLEVVDDDKVKYSV